MTGTLTRLPGVAVVGAATFATMSGLLPTPTAVVVPLAVLLVVLASLAEVAIVEVTVTGVPAAGAV